MSTVRDRRAREELSRVAMGRWFHNYWRTLKYWRQALRRDPRDATLPHWPTVNVRRSAEHWPRRVFTECACSMSNTHVTPFT